MIMSSKCNKIIKIERRTGNWKRNNHLSSSSLSLLLSSFVSIFNLIEICDLILILPVLRLLTGTLYELIICNIYNNNNNIYNDNNGDGNNNYDYTYPLVCIFIIFAIFISTNNTATSIAISDASSNPVINIYISSSIIISFIIKK